MTDSSHWINKVEKLYIVFFSMHKPITTIIFILNIIHKKIYLDEHRAGLGSLGLVLNLSMQI